MSTNKQMHLIKLKYAPTSPSEIKCQTEAV